MNTTRHFLTPVCHQSGEGFSFAVVTVNVELLMRLSNSASAALTAVCALSSESWGEMTIRGFCTGVLFNGVYDDGDELSLLCEEANKDVETPLEITEEQAEKFSALEAAARFESAGFSIQKSCIPAMEHRVFLSAYPRHGEGEAVSTKDFAFVIAQVARFPIPQSDTRALALP